MGGRGSRAKQAGQVPDPALADSKTDADAAEVAGNVARENRKNAVEAQISGDAPAAKLAARSAESANKDAQRLASAVEARSAANPQSTALRTEAERARTAASFADLDARSARRAANSAARVATGNFRR